MKNIALAGVSVLVVFGLCQGVVARKPHMTPVAEEIVIQEGDELRLECWGEGRMHFSIQETETNTNGSEFHILYNQITNVYTFYRPNVIRQDTRWYACAKEGVPVRNDEQNIDHESNDIAWIYVYVNSSAPFANDAQYNFLTAVAGGRLVVPCRTTSPDLEVKLEINWGTTDIPAGTTYLPKLGFMMTEVGRELSGQSLECQVMGSDTAVTSYTLHVADPASLDKPRINTDQIHHVVWGRDLTVDCEITSSSGTVFSMFWKVPESVPKKRWSYGHYRVLVAPDGQTIWKTVLTVRNVEKTDEGEYLCIAEHPWDHVESRAMIRIWDPSETYINTTVEGFDHITLHEHEKVIWKINIDTFPENLSLAWYKPNGQEISKNESNESTKYSHTQDGLWHFFKIMKLGVEDDGIYTIDVSNGNERKKIALELTVLGKSHSHMLLIGFISVFGIIVIIVIAFMGIRLHQEKVLRKELLDAVSVNYQEGAVSCSTVDQQSNLLSNDEKLESLRERSTSDN